MIVKLKLDLPGQQEMHLEIVFVAMGLHIAAKKAAIRAKD